MKNIVNTFQTQIESAKSFEKTKKEITENKDKQKEILKDIENIQKKLKSGEEAKKFKYEIDAISYDKEMGEIAGNIIEEAQEKIRELSKILSNDNKEFSDKEAEGLCKYFCKFIEDLQIKVHIALEKEITNNIQKNANELLNQYKNKIKLLAEDLYVEGNSISETMSSSHSVSKEGGLSKTFKIIGGLATKRYRFDNRCSGNRSCTSYRW